MFIGDSLTCGEYAERFPPEDDATPRSTNAARSYAMLVARWLDAQVPFAELSEAIRSNPLIISGDTAFFKKN